MARRIYRILIAISIGLGVLLFMIKETHSKVFLIIISSFMFLLLSMGIHGLLAHSLNPKIKESTLFYPLLMGLLWAILFLIFVFFIVPVFCPDFFFLDIG